MSKTFTDALADKRILDLFEALTKIVLAIAATSYALGLFVTNMHLSVFGYYSLSLVRVNYAMAGVWCLVVVGSTVSLLVLTIKALHELLADKIALRKRVLIALTLAFVFISIGYFLPGAANRLHIQGGWREWLWIPFGGAIGVLLSTTHISRLFSDKPIDEKLESASQTILSIFLLSSYVFFFSTNIYPSIPGNIGGGMPQLAQLLIQSDEKESLQSIGLHFIETHPDSSQPQSNFCLTDTVRILTSTDNYLVLLSKDNSAQSIVISNQYFLAIRNIVQRDK